MPTQPSRARRRSTRRRRRVATIAALGLTCGMLAACSANADGPVELVWYTNPDTGGQAAVAENCSTDRYTVTTQVLPTAAEQQRIQLARRLAAKDTAIDLMSLDPPFTAEFADAGFLADVPDGAEQKVEDYGTFQGAIDAATWQDELVVYPFWSNTQVLWYRKSFVEKAGIDMSEPVTWEQVIDVASANGGQIGVQADKYEGYSVWINALVEGAGGSLAENTEAGADAEITVDEEAGNQAAQIISELAGSKAAPADLSVSNEGTALSTFASDAGSFMVNWTFVFHNYDESAPDVAEDIGYAPYPRSVEGEPAAPPYGGIGVGVSAFSDNVDLATQAAQCIIEPENQGINAEITGNMPASTQGYDYPALQELYPPDLLDLFQDSVDQAAPRTVTPYWSDISGGLQSTWHPPGDVTEQTPEESASFIEEVLKGRTLL